MLSNSCFYLHGDSCVSMHSILLQCLIEKQLYVTMTCLKMTLERETNRTEVRSTFFQLPYNMGLFDDYDDTSSCEFRQLYPLRNHCSLIFIFVIIDSKGLTNNFLDFFLPPSVVAQKISLEMNRGRWVFLKMAFLISSKQQGSFAFTCTWID